MNCGLIKRRKCWRPTFQGWLLILGVVCLFVFSFLRMLFPFLAVSQPVSAEVLVVEGWVPDYLLHGIEIEFENRPYEVLLISGPAIIAGEPFAEYGDYATLTQAVLLAKGWDAGEIVALSNTNAVVRRTHSSAEAVKEWLSHADFDVTGINIFSLGAHARRSRLVYSAVVPSGINVGVIAGKDLRYDGERWLRTYDGFRIVANEAFAYLYERVSRPFSW